jgi:hypothetical protein
MGKATQEALKQLWAEQITKRINEKKFDVEYYVDVATGEVKKRLYTGREKKSYPPKQEEE